MPRKSPPPDLGPHRWFKNARYLGGHSTFTEGWSGVPFFTTDAIGLGVSSTAGPTATVVPMQTVASVQITGQQVSKSKVGPVLVFGLYGLAARGSKQDTTVVVRTKDGETIYFSIADNSPDQVRAVLTPHLAYVHVPFFDEVESPQSEVDELANQLRTLGALRDEGLLTDAEFETQKAQLLNRAAPAVSPETSDHRDRQPRK